MIKIIAVLITIFINALIIYVLFNLQKEKYETEISKMQKTLSDKTKIIKNKNKKNKELKDELKRTNNSRLRKNH